MARRYALRDDQWDRIRDLLPGRAGHVGVTAKDNRLFVEAVLYRYRAGIPWRDLPERFGDFRVVHLRHSRWSRSGVWQRVFEALSEDAPTRADGRPVPGVAPAAKQMGKHVARVLAARLRGDAAALPFRYRDQGNLATIGRMAAIVHIGRFKLSGLPAWWFWLAAHVFFLIGFRNRFVVLVNWAMAYWSYQRAARIIFGGPGEALPLVQDEHERPGS